MCYTGYTHHIPCIYRHVYMVNLFGNTMPICSSFMPPPNILKKINTHGLGINGTHSGGMTRCFPRLKYSYTGINPAHWRPADDSSSGNAWNEAVASGRSVGKGGAPREDAASLSKRSTIARPNWIGYSLRSVAQNNRCPVPKSLVTSKNVSGV